MRTFTLALAAAITLGLSTSSAFAEPFGSDRHDGGTVQLVGGGHHGHHGHDGHHGHSWHHGWHGHYDYHPHRYGPSYYSYRYHYYPQYGYGYYYSPGFSIYGPRFGFSFGY